MKKTLLLVSALLITGCSFTETTTEDYTKFEEISNKTIELTKKLNKAEKENRELTKELKENNTLKERELLCNKIATETYVMFKNNSRENAILSESFLLPPTFRYTKELDVCSYRATMVSPTNIMLMVKNTLDDNEVAVKTIDVTTGVSVDGEEYNKLSRKLGYLE